MVRKFFALLCAVLMLAVPAGQCFALEGGHIYDYADIIDDAAEEALEKDIAAVIDTIGMDVVVLTADDTDGQESLAYADDFYDYNGFGMGDDFSGILFFIDMDNRVPTISTSGTMIDYITDARLEEMLDAVWYDLSDGDFAGSVETFLLNTEYFYWQGIPDGQHRVETGPAFDGFDLLMTIIVMGVIFCVFFFSVRAGYELRGSTYSYDVGANSAMKLNHRLDRFINRTVSTRVIEEPKSSSSGTRSTVHHSSSGRSHGGGSGRRF